MTAPERAVAAAWTPTRRDLLFGGALAAAGGIAYARVPRRQYRLIAPGQIERLVPLRLGGWHFQAASGIVLPPPDQLAHLLYDTQLTRTYESATDLPVMLLIAYGSSQSGMLQIHRPETCYPASGFRLTATATAMLPVGGGIDIPVRRFSASSDTRVEQVLYWTRIGNALPVSWAAQRMAVVRSNLHGFVPDGLLVRLSAITGDVEAGQAALERFARVLVDALGRRRRLLIGDR